MCRWDRVEDCTFWRLRQQLLQQPLEANAAKKVNVEVVYDEEEHVVVVVTTAATATNIRSLAMMMQLLQQLSNEIRTDWPCSSSSNNKKTTTTTTRKRRITLM